MINVAAIRMQQFGVQFYQASLTASDIDKLVRFEVLNYGDNAQPPVRGGKQRAGLGGGSSPGMKRREGVEGGRRVGQGHAQDRAKEGEEPKQIAYVSGAPVELAESGQKEEREHQRRHLVPVLHLGESPYLSET